MKKIKQCLNITEIKKQLLLASYRVEVKITDNFINEIILDIKDFFPLKKSDFIIEAIKEGGSGKYGVSYKFTIQLVLYWINSKIKNKNNQTRGKL